MVGGDAASSSLPIGLCHAHKGQKQDCWVKTILYAVGLARVLDVEFTRQQRHVVGVD
jgi:hypothetical protein